MMKPNIYNYRFEIFLLSQLGILFGSLIFPFELFDTVFSPLLFIINLFAGILLTHNKPKLKRILIALILCSVTVFGIQLSLPDLDLSLLRITINFLFYLLVTFELVTQVWKAQVVSTNVIAGLISGYISLGFIGYFICMSIVILNPTSFGGINPDLPLTDEIMYYAYITLLTIGYGDV